jgi:dienelactone hydrolase
VVTLVKLENIVVPSGKITLLGRIYRPEERKRRPAVAVCHGFPGDTKNMDLAEELALNGIVTLLFYYQGAWGSGGKYSLTKLATGTKSAVAYLRKLSFVDPERIGLVSHSMGALPLTKTMSVDRLIKTGVLMSPAADSLTLAEGGEERAKRFASMAVGKLSGATKESLLKDFGQVAKDTNPMTLVPLIKAPVMVIVGAEDTVTPPAACRRLFEAANEPKAWLEIDGADHGYSEHRIPLIRAVIERLKDTL